MARVPERLSAGGGGAATSAGIHFQQQLGALVGTWLLGERPLDRRLALGHAIPLWVRFETEAPVDDILVATSAGGFVAIQAKTTASLSRDLVSPFGKTISQFVRHWLACRDGDGSLHWNRPLDPLTDRLVLAVSREAPATVREDLPAALRLRAQPGGGVLTEAQTRAFNDFESCIALAWAAATTDPFEPAFAESLARLVTVFTFDPAGSDLTASLAVLQSLVVDPDAAPAALNALEALSGDYMAQRGGADLTTLRQALTTRGIRLSAPLGHRADIAALRAHSETIAAALERYEVIEATAGNRISVARDCQAAIEEAALGGSLLIVGEPGAGKSGVLSALARGLRERGNDVIEMAVDRYSVETLEGLKNELGLEHGLIDTLAAWDGVGPGWLVIDALDATRGGKGEGVFRSLIEQVLERGGRWRVIASIRSFDLRMGQQFRSLFKGTPPVEHLQEAGFASVRHICVPSWSQGEFQQLLKQAPALANALANAPAALRQLAAVPFNTRLMSDLVKNGLISADFSEVASQAELLQLYWAHRVEGHGAAARACIQRIAQSMVDARALRAPFAVAASGDAAMIDTLERDGVVISVDNGRWVQFRHHLLFDFAAARVLLDPDALIAGTLRFPKVEARGLMLAPALTFVLREIWDRQQDRSPFWTAATNILADNDGDPVIRSATGRICAEYPVAVNDLHTLAGRVVAGDARAARAFEHISGALAIRLEDYPATALGPWVRLLRDIAPNVAPVSNTVRFLLFRLVPSVDDIDARADIGFAARALLAHAFSTQGQRNLAASAIDLVADTCSTDPAASRALLERIFEPDRLPIFGAEEVPAICRRIEAICDCDPDFAVEIYRVSFGFEVTEERETRMGDSQILALRSNARQDYGMARYALGEFVPTFLERHPDHALSAIVDAVEGYVAREHPRKPEMVDAQVSAGGRVVRLREDWSHIWGHDPDSDYGHDAETLIKKLLNHLRAAEPTAALQLAEQLTTIGSLAIFWSRLFLVAVERDDAMLELVLPIAMSEPFLLLPDTRKDAVDVVAKGYPRLDLKAREAFENAVGQFDFSAFQRPANARAHLERRLFGAIGADNLATRAARAIIVASGETDDGDNDRLFVIRTTSEAPEAYHWIQGFDRESAANQSLMSAIDGAKQALGIESDAHDGSEVTFPASLAAMEALAAQVDRETQNPSLVIYAEGIIARGIDRLISQRKAPPLEEVRATQRLLALLDLAARSAGPLLHEDTEADFERGASWGSPAPRVDAGPAVLDLCLQRPDLYPDLAPMIDALLEDAHPAVRLQAALRLVRIWDIDRPGFWQRLSARLSDETNQGVLDHVISGVLSRVLHADPDRVEPLALALLGRFDQDPERASRMRTALSGQVAILWVTHQRTEARAVLTSWIADLAKHQSELSQIVATMRSAFVVGLQGEAKPDDDGLRHRAQQLALEIVMAANAGMEAYFSRESNSEQEQKEAHECARLLDSVCSQLYFAIGAGKEKAVGDAAFDHVAFVRFFEETASILHGISTYATPHTVYYLLQLLEFLLPIAPARAFDLTAHALRSGGRRNGYQFESLGADLLVRLVGMFLADHKELFEDADRRAALIDCLDIFMEAGWPAARRLLYRLPELIQ
jgi:hypothetical protein